MPQQHCFCDTAAAGIVRRAGLCLAVRACRRGRDATPLEVRRAYRQQALRCHPDKLASRLGTSACREGSRGAQTFGRLQGARRPRRPRRVRPAAPHRRLALGDAQGRARGRARERKGDVPALLRGARAQQRAGARRKRAPWPRSPGRSRRASWPPSCAPRSSPARSSWCRSRREPRARRSHCLARSWAPRSTVRPPPR